MANKPRLAITIGDPAGIGPEIALKAAADRSLHSLADIAVVGSRSALITEAARIGIPRLLDTCRIVDVDLPVSSVLMGEISSECGAASYEYLKKAIELAKSREVDAIVTAPVHKESWKAAGVPHIGHTEALSSAFGMTGETLFVVGGLRIFFLTRHLSLKKAIESMSTEKLLALLRHAQHSLGWFGIKEPRIAVAALNPHAGDGGLFGDEESRILLPAVESAQAEGIKAFGPLPADSVFHQCARGQFDAVISLYHDQGHIAAKMHDFLGTVSVTTGLPAVRVSVDHGTAFDIAGKNLADPGSMVAAITLAAELVRARSGT